jgi:hypothetical protein
MPGLEWMPGGEVMENRCRKGGNIDNYYIIGEIYLYLNHIILSTKNKTKKFKINYKDITFHAIEKQKRLIILCDMNKYNIINIICNTQEEINELFNQLCICINDNNNINIDNVELEEEGINNEKLLEEWEKKMIFNDKEENK